MFRFLILLGCLCSSGAVFAQFEGELALEPPGCQAQGQCTLKDKLRFTDAQGVVWEARAGLTTDGASIPGFFQPFVGQPFEQQFIKAAVIHDHYCDRHVRSWRVTHKVFYEGLVNQGVPEGKAKLMYYAVYLGGPKWVELVPGNQCGGNCINNITLKSGKPRINFRVADYGLFNMTEELRGVEALLAANPDAISIEQLEAMARAKRPNDYYFRNGDRVVINDGMLTE